MARHSTHMVLADFYASIVVTAIEGGIGYWSEVQTYRWWFPDVAHPKSEAPPNGEPFAWADARELFDEKHQFKVDRALVERGILTLMSAPEPLVGRPLMAALGVAVATRDAGEVDADLADVIVQAGHYGKVVWG